MGVRDGEIWQDREIRFDIPAREFLPRLGEIEIDSINAVEDTKGNNGIRGSLSVTNLRIRWVSHKHTNINLSIGLNMVSRVQIKNSNSRLRGTVQALFLIATDTKTKARYMFIFTSLVNASPRLFTTVQAVYRAYDTSRPYRELKLRGALIHDQGLRTLPDEEIYETIGGVWNLSADQGNLGTFFITTVRIVWFADLAPNFNVSVPYFMLCS